MTGSAFILYKDTWGCTNEASYQNALIPVLIEGELPKVYTREQRVNLSHFFAPEKPINEGDLCEIAFMGDDSELSISLIGQVKTVGNLTVVNILKKTDDIKELLRKIDTKIKNHGR